MFLVYSDIEEYLERSSDEELSRISVLKFCVIVNIYAETFFEIHELTSYDRKKFTYPSSVKIDWDKRWRDCKVVDEGVELEHEE